MGQKRKFTCSYCTYSALVSGGRDVGMQSVVRTCVCQKCQALTDVLIGAYGQDCSTGDVRYDAALNRCALCGSTKITPWLAPYPCPQCEHAMTVGEIELLWD